jgi:hypothetical protein
MQHACTIAGVEVFRIDSNDGIKKWLDRVRNLD